MAFPKYRPAPPPKNRLIVEKRIIDGKMKKVETYNGKVARVYDDDGKLLEDRSKKLKIILPTPPLEPRIRRENKPEDTPPQEDVRPQEEKPTDESPILELPHIPSTPTQIDEKAMSGTEESLQLIPENDMAKPINAYNEQPKLPTENAKEEKIDIPKIEDIPKSESQKIEPNTEEISDIKEIIGSGLSQQLDNTTNIQQVQDIPINQQPKLSPRKVDIPKVERQKESQNKTNAQRETREMGIPGVPIKNENRINKLIDNKISNTQIVDKTKVENKITEITKAEKQPIEDEITKENKNMVEELLEEYKREQWAKKRDFEKNIEDMARVASENKGQIKEISQKIEGVTGKVEEVEEKIGGLQENLQDRLVTLQERLGDIKKPVSDTLGELCTGVDCIKTDIKKAQEYQQSSDKRVDGRFQELSERLQKLEEPTYVCDSCGQDNIRPLSSFCPNCGAPIHSWTDPETGMPISGWAPFWKRARGSIE